MTTPLRTRYRLTYVLAALSAGALIAVAAVPQRARAEDSRAQAEADRCAAIPPGFGHPPINLTPVTLQLVQPSVEPVPATDELIHLVYEAQVTNTQAQPADIVSVVPVDALADFAPTGRNLGTFHGQDVTSKVALLRSWPPATW